VWPSAATIQGLITAMFDLVERHGVGPDQTKKLRISLCKTAFDMHGGFSSYKGKFQALLSSHYVAAVILHDRELSLAQFEPARYNDPRLVRFASDRVEVRPDPVLVGTQAVVEAESVEGSTITVRCDHAKGSPENPLSRAQIEGKFRTYAKTRLPDSRVAEAIGVISRLEELGSTRRLMDILRAGN
jgi:2-methylcitrate dehydratase PrpD